ncbi:MAG: amidohydrolase, partial [Sphingomicrobium sp.]
MTRALLAMLLAATAVPASAETIAITGGTVALGDGSEPIPGGTVVIRDGRIVAAGGMQMKLPGGTQVIDATGKWVTPGIVAGFSRLGLAEVDLTASEEDGGGRSDTSGAADDTTSNGPFNAAIDVVPAINPLDSTIAVNRADGVTRAIVAPGAGKNIFAGQGAVIDTGADLDPVTAARKFQFVEMGETGAAAAGGSRASTFALFRNALREASQLRRYATPVQSTRNEALDQREQPVVRDPNESRLYNGQRNQDVLLTRYDAAALVAVLQGR